LTKGLANSSKITSGRVSALEESMLDDMHHGCPDVGHTKLQTQRKTSPSHAL
jgi:hypothetical protein